MNRQLDGNNKDIFDNEDEEEKRNIQMKKDLFRSQLESQAKEIDILKTEINLYKKKGGHIYTKVTTNRRVAHLNDNWAYEHHASYTPFIHSWPLESIVC